MLLTANATAPLSRMRFPVCSAGSHVQTLLRAQSTRDQRPHTNRATSDERWWTRRQGLRLRRHRHVHLREGRNKAATQTRSPRDECADRCTHPRHAQPRTRSRREVILAIAVAPASPTVVSAVHSLGDEKDVLFLPSPRTLHSLLRSSRVMEGFAASAVAPSASTAVSVEEWNQRVSRNANARCVGR